MTKHGILVIKKNNEYLQYYDERWDSYLFLNCKLDNDDRIKECIKNMLSIDNVEYEYVATKVHTKYSVSHKTNREYEHTFYKVNILLERIMNNKEFIINNIKFKWFTKEELDSDTRIQEVNSDIINFIYELNL